MIGTNYNDILRDLQYFDYSNINVLFTCVYNIYNHS